MIRTITLAAVAAAALAVPTNKAEAAGCNGVVNWFVWGCAGWDNNNGPRYPYFKKVEVQRNAPKGSEVQVKDGAAAVKINGQWMPVAGGASTLVAAGGGNLVAAGGGNIVNAGGLNLRVIQQQ